MTPRASSAPAVMKKLTTLVGLLPNFSTMGMRIVLPGISMTPLSTMYKKGSTPNLSPPRESPKYTIPSTRKLEYSESVMARIFLVLEGRWGLGWRQVAGRALCSEDLAAVYDKELNNNEDSSNNRASARVFVYNNRQKVREI